jgi:catechol 2,3-dioxygenase-like lactoylglutathione lyase family enzyme
MLKTAIPILASLNEEETVKFYTEKLGFTLNSSWDGYLLFTRDEIEIHLSPCDNPEIAKNNGCYVNVTELDKLYAEYNPTIYFIPKGILKISPGKPGSLV